MRKITKTRLVPFQPYDGAPVELVPEKYTVEVPRDWDRALLGAAVTGTGLLLILAVIWSTASIGPLLALGGVAAPIAYGVAGVFDLAWIICMLLEWLARYQPAKAQAPRKAGYAFLVVAMAAIGAHGGLAGHWQGLIVGLVGAAVSLVAKSVWSLTIRHAAQELSPVAQQWVARRQSAAGAELAMAAVGRQLARSNAHLIAYREAYDTPAPSVPVELDAPADGITATERSAIRAALALTPDIDVLDLVEQLARIGIDTTADTVRTVSGQQSDSQGSSSGRVLALAPHDPADTITDTVRAVARTLGRDLDAVHAAVCRVHGPSVKRETVRRILSDRVTA